ncbi:MAG: AIR synthase-related protein, partial [Lysobacterales bacterium]
LVGGDTTRGPLSVSVTLLGTVPRGRAVTRAGAQAGDDLWVAGVLGDAAAGLACVEGRLAASARDRASLVRALDRPQPPLAFGLSLRGVASAMIDVSDGVYADLSHVLRASGLGATFDPSLLPASAVLHRVVPDISEREIMQCSGDDYTLLFTAPPLRARKVAAIAHHLGVRVSKIGAMHQRKGLWRTDTGKSPRRIAASGFDHFATLSRATVVR